MQKDLISSSTFDSSLVSSDDRRRGGSSRWRLKARRATAVLASQQGGRGARLSRQQGEVVASVARIGGRKERGWR